MSYNFTSNQTGDTSQKVVELDLIRRGWIVCLPISRDSRFDLVVSRGGGVFVTIQVKSAYGGRIRCTTRSGCAEFVSKFGKLRNTHHYRDLGIDWIVGVTKDGKCWYYPKRVFTNYESINIRTVPPVEFGVANVASSQPVRGSVKPTTIELCTEPTLYDDTAFHRVAIADIKRDMTAVR